MRRLVVVVLVVLVLGGVVVGCASDGGVHRERIDGVECLVRRDRLNGRVVALSCDWSSR